MALLNETHDPALRSWVASANRDGGDFPIQNLPFAVFRRRESNEAWRGGVAIGDEIIDLAAVVRNGGFAGTVAQTAGSEDIVARSGGRERTVAQTVGLEAMAARIGGFEHTVATAGFEDIAARIGGFEHIAAPTTGFEDMAARIGGFEHIAAPTDGLDDIVASTSGFEETGERSGGFEPRVDAALQAAAEPLLNRYMALGPRSWSALRLALSRALREGAPQIEAWRTCLVSQSDAEFRVPARIGDYTDFYTSVYHATAVGRLFRPDNPLLPNYRWLPIGYHGRASSLAVSGQAFHRPQGQTLPLGSSEPVLGPSKRIDYELELGIYVGMGTELGMRIPIAAADEHVFGLCLLNDWSARDLQAWESQPLGPFLAKSFATTLSPWIITNEALAPFRTAWTRAAGEPQPLPYLDSPTNRDHGAFDIQLQVEIETARMRANGVAPMRVSTTSYRHAYWTAAQLIAHHSVNGCNLQPGDLLGTGTQSGPLAEEAGSLLELTHGGKQPLKLTNGEFRTFLEDGDTIIFSGRCFRPGAAPIGFGKVSGTLLPHR